jgi:hypothetical protein
MGVAGNNPVDKQPVAQAVDEWNARAAEAIREWQVMERLAESRSSQRTSFLGTEHVNTIKAKSSATQRPVWQTPF